MEYGLFGPGARLLLLDDDDIKNLNIDTEKSEPEQPEYSDYGITPLVWEATPYTVEAIQYQEKNLIDVVRFMHGRKIPFASCCHGDLHVILAGNRVRDLKPGEWVVFREDAETKTRVLSAVDFNLNYGLARSATDAYDSAQNEED